MFFFAIGQGSNKENKVCQRHNACFQKKRFLGKKHFGLLRQQNLGEISVNFARRKTLTITQQ